MHSMALQQFPAAIDYSPYLQAPTTLSLLFLILILDLFSFVHSPNK